ncbi:dentin sialophosphoprotein isoform X2 [Thalassophryne amazonica]|uniref:dentin sialophosphoprotein isoform X2 n=1 Tax=Thalassophryne amazonica TaxID=390379 RepID=UPI0014722DCA|nr:dentin sialophosphoprotein isoform X2 [Thalassophryne amazonica]
MEQNFADLFSGAFSDSLPAFPESDFNFESLNFEETFKEDMKESLHMPSKDDEVLHSQPAAQMPGLSSLESNDKDMAGSDDEQPSDTNNSEEQQGKSPEVHCTSSSEDSELEDCVAGEEADTGQQSLLMSVHSSEEFWRFNTEVEIFAEGQLPATEGTDKPQKRNEESESDKEALYCGEVSKGDVKVITKDDGIEEEVEIQKNSVYEGVKMEKDEGKEDKALPQDFGQQDGNIDTGRLVRDLCDSPEISMQSLEELDADTEDHVDNIQDFSKDEYQEAGESFADYPSDFSSCEYVEERSTKVEKSPHQVDTLPCEPNSCSEQIVTDVTWLGCSGDTGRDTDKHLHCKEVDTDEVVDLDQDRGQRQIVEHIWGDPSVGVIDHEVGECDESSSSEDDAQGRKSDEVFSGIFDLKDQFKPLEDTESQRDKVEFANWSICEDLGITRGDQTVFQMCWNTDVSTNKAPLYGQLFVDEENHETLSPDVNQHPKENICANSYSITTKTLCPSNQGSVDDSFFFNTDPVSSGFTEVGQLGDDESEDETNWEQEQERIEAFYKFYNDSDGENERKGREVKVQFSTDTSSRVIQYDTDSSDRNSLNSSTDSEDDPNSVDTSEFHLFQDMRDSDDTLNNKPAFGLPNTPVAEKEPELSWTVHGTKKHKHANTLKLILRMGLVILFGLLMFWMAKDQVDWLGPISFF